MDLFEQFASNDFLPHGYCVAWQPGIVWLHLISDTIIALAYYSIPLALAYFVAARKDLTFKWVFKLFIVFIIACGTTHLMSIITLWEPAYWIDGGVKVVTAGASLLTAILLWPLIPQALALPSRSQLEIINQELHKEIIERQQVTEALKKSENLYRTLARHLPHMGVLLFDTDLRFLIAEGEALNPQGYLSQEIEGQTLGEVLPAQNAQLLEPYYRQALAGVEQTLEWPITERIYYVQFLPVRNEHGEIFAGLAVMQDITERTQMEGDLRQAKETAEIASQAKTEFLANMSHELRTPLNGILGYAQILNRDEALNAKQAEAVRTIQRSGDHLLLMINDILDLSKIEAGKMELILNEFHFPSFLQVIADIIQVRALQKKLSFNFEPDLDLPVGLYADEKRLRQILLNLLGNAVKFTQEGRVTFRISRVKEASTPQTQRIRFEIEDTGVGIPPESLEDIFQPFHQVRQSQIQQEGTGLGLAISRQLAGLMGGEIQVKSQPGQGSLFWFELQLSEAVKVMIETESIQQRVVGYTANRPNLKILIVDDRADNRAVLRDVLSGLGFIILEATNGKEAVAKARQERPDLILMDLVMPILDGYEATRQIRQLFPVGEMVIVALSASVLDGSREKSLEAGCDDFITKPLVIDELLQQLQIHLGVTWLYDETKPVKRNALKTGPVVPPSQAVLQNLRDLARLGDITALRREIDLLKQEEASGQAAFGARVGELVEEFRLNEVIKFIDLYLNA